MIAKSFNILVLFFKMKVLPSFEIFDKTVGAFSVIATAKQCDSYCKTV